MNTWQMTKQLQFLLGRRAWPGAPANTFVFPQVIISVGLDQKVLQRFRLPLAMIRIMGGSSDPNHNEEPRLIRQTYNVRVYTAVSSDGIGERALMGGHRTGGKDESLGRGILEVEEQLIEALGRLTGIDGARIICRARSMVDADLNPERDHIAVREYAFEAMVGNARFYHPATRLSGTPTGGGNVDLTWRLPPNRFDFVRMRLRRAAGSTPPATPTAGTDVTLADPVNDTSVTDSPGVGTFSYSIFAMYDDLNEPATDETVENSAAESVTVIVT